MLRWTERAVTDLLAIGDHITADNPAAARAWVETLRQRAAKASRAPGSGRVVPEIGRDDVREVFQRLVNQLHAQGTGSANRVERMYLLVEPPSTGVSHRRGQLSRALRTVSFAPARFHSKSEGNLHDQMSRYSLPSSLKPLFLRVSKMS